MADKYLPSPSLRQVILKIYFIFIFILHIFPDWCEDTVKVKCPTHAGIEHSKPADLMFYNSAISLATLVY